MLRKISPLYFYHYVFESHIVSTAAMLGAAAIGGGLTLGSGLIGSAIGARASDKASERAAEAQEAINAANIAYQTEENQRNREFQEKWNLQQHDWDVENRDINYQRQLAENNLTRQREDTALQRQVADARMAGLSPLQANAASAASMNAAQSDMSAVNSSPSGRAPHVSSDGFLQAAQLQAQNGRDVGDRLQQSVGAAISNYQGLQDMQTRQSVGNAQAAYMQSKTDETDINNAYLHYQNVLSLMKMKEEVSHLNLSNKEKSIWNSHLNDYIDSAISSNFAGASLNNAQAAHAYGTEQRAKDMFDLQRQDSVKYNVPFNTSFSMPLGGPQGILGAAHQLASDIPENARRGWNFTKDLVGTVADGAYNLTGKIGAGLRAAFDMSYESAERQQAIMELIQLRESGKISKDEYIRMYNRIGR